MSIVDEQLRKWELFRRNLNVEEQKAFDEVADIVRRHRIALETCKAEDLSEAILILACTEIKSEIMQPHGEIGLSRYCD